MNLHKIYENIKYWTGDNLSYHERYKRATFMVGLAAVGLFVALSSSIVIYGFGEKEKKNKQIMQEIRQQGLEAQLQIIEGTLDGNFVTLTNGVNYLISSFYPSLDTTETYQLRSLYDADGLSGRLVGIRKIINNQTIELLVEEVQQFQDSPYHRNSELLVQFCEILLFLSLILIDQRHSNVHHIFQ